MSVTVDHEPLPVDKLGLDTVGQVLAHLQKDHRLVVQVLIMGYIPVTALTPVTTYWLTPRIMQHYGWQFRPGRFVPGPIGRYFLPWPPKFASVP